MLCFLLTVKLSNTIHMSKSPLVAQVSLEAHCRFECNLIAGSLYPLYKYFSLCVFVYMTNMELIT